MSVSITSVSSTMRFKDDQLYMTSHKLGRSNSSEADFWSGKGNLVQAYQQASGAGSPLSVPNGHSHSHPQTFVEAVKRMVF